MWGRAQKKMVSFACIVALSLLYRLRSIGLGGEGARWEGRACSGVRGDARTSPGATEAPSERRATAGGRPRARRLPPGRSRARPARCAPTARQRGRARRQRFECLECQVDSTKAVAAAAAAARSQLSFLLAAVRSPFVRRCWRGRPAVGRRRAESMEPEGPPPCSVRGGLIIATARTGFMVNADGGFYSGASPARRSTHSRIEGCTQIGPLSTTARLLV